MKDATYRLLRTVGGITYFAAVTVSVERGNGRIEAIACIDAADDAAGEVSEAAEPTWVKAAIAGANLALNDLQSAGRISDGCKVQITRVVGSVMDTRDDVVECAALMATFKAVDGACGSLKPTFDGKRWKVELSK